MHPAYSVIFFTTASGAGFGLLALLGVLAPAGLLPADRWTGVAMLLAAGILAVAGLMSSTFHLRRRSRAIYAFSQWRSSWLSREGVASVATFVPAGVFAVGWVIFETTGGLWALAGLVAALGAALTVLSTGMIYAVLKPVRQWRDPLVVPVYLLFAAATGAVWLTALASLFGMPERVPAILALIGLVAAWGAKLLYWRRIDGAPAGSSLETATGLGGIGPVRSLSWPHTEENYLLKEMGFRVARKHAVKLRVIAVVLGGLVPFALILAALPIDGSVEAILALLALVSAMMGTLVERWLFFAEARHTVSLYYGRSIDGD